jgi:hypothetical protein
VQISTMTIGTRDAFTEMDIMLEEFRRVVPKVIVTRQTLILCMGNIRAEGKRRHDQGCSQYDLHAIHPIMVRIII